MPDLTDWRTISDDKEKYQAYLCSREWAEKREAVRERCKGICERCDVLPMNSTHHLTYVRKYNEIPEDLQSICNACHAFTHGKNSFDPLKNRGWLQYLIECKKDGTTPVPEGFVSDPEKDSDLANAGHYADEIYIYHTLYTEVEKLCLIESGSYFSDRTPASLIGGIEFFIHHKVCSEIPWEFHMWTVRGRPIPFEKENYNESLKLIGLPPGVNRKPPKTIVNPSGTVTCIVP